jgi:sugar lactone lactonase YvrE
MRYTAAPVADGFTFPETPRWHAGRQAFYFVDIDRGKLFELKDGRVRLLYQSQDWISGITFDDADGFFITAVNQRKILHLTGCLTGIGQTHVVADCSSLAHNGINDMVRGPRGDFYVGSVNYDAVAGFSRPVEKVRSPLLRVSPGGKVEIGSDATFFSNGSVIAPSGERLLVADSFDQCVYSFAIRPDGSLGPANRFADCPGEGPDGMCMDAEGGLWIASHHRCFRVEEGGRVTDEVDTGATTASACMLGGADGRTLLITGSDGHDREKLYRVSSGVLLQAKVKIPGVGLPSLYA